MFHACGDISAGLVEAARRAGAFAICVQRCRGWGHRSARVDLDANGNNRTVRRAATMGAPTGVDTDRVGRVVRADLSPRRASMAGVECL